MLSELVEVTSRFQRSVNLERDYVGGDAAAGEYIITATARKVLRLIVEGLEGDGAYRCLSLTGPYGAGKSAFALFMTRLLCGEPRSRRESLEHVRSVDPWLGQLLSEAGTQLAAGPGYLPVLITSRRAPAPLCVLQGLNEALGRVKGKHLGRVANRVTRICATATENGRADSREVTAAVEASCRAAVDDGYAGTVLILDEAGKLFEHCARDPIAGDVYILQEMAEAAARSDAAPLLFISLLHQGFDEYGRHLDRATRQEWKKIQGRFTDVAFQESTEQLMELIASAIRLRADEPMPRLTATLRSLRRDAVKCGVAPPAMPRAIFEDVVTRCFPFHPSALVALPVLFNRFAQNERSLFSYLTSLEPGGFQEFLQTRAVDPEHLELIRLTDLFDYFSMNFGAGLYRQPHARRWLEAADALDRKHDLSAHHRDVVKVVGVLSVAGEFSHLQATEEAIAFSLDDSVRFTESTRAVVHELQEQSLLIYRKFNDTYKVWEGSDVDIEERVAEGLRKVGRLGPADLIESHLASRPLVARRHSFETGALRYFATHYVDQPDEIVAPKHGRGAADGTVFVCLAESSAHAEEFRKRAETARAQANVLFAIPQQIGDLRAAALELGALRWAWDQTPELRDDRVARREIALRITEAEQLLSARVAGILDPRPEPDGSACHWYWVGEHMPVRAPLEVSQLLSTVCDDLYHQSPSLRNELVVRRSISSAAAAARRNLIEAMLIKGDQPQLGLTGFPPERSVYESVLRATGIHQKGNADGWTFGAPGGPDGRSLMGVWRHFENRLLETVGGPVPLDAVYSELMSPPFGVLEGVLPILLCAFICAHPDEVTLYREGTFVAEPSVADFEILLRRPELFAVAGCKIEGSRRAVVDRLARALNVSPTTVSVVRALFRSVGELPEFSRKTRNLSKHSLKLRDAFADARSPEQFLFSMVPEALGLQSISADGRDSSEVSEFFTALNQALQAWAAAAPSVFETARDQLLRASELPASEEGWRRLRQLSLNLEGWVTEPQLLAFVRRVVQSGSDHEGQAAVLGLVASRPPGSWDDTDVERFPAAAEVIGRAFSQAARLAGLVSASPRGIDQLPEERRHRARALLSKLRVVLEKEPSTDPQVVKAALAELVAESDSTADGRETA